MNKPCKNCGLKFEGKKSEAFCSVDCSREFRKFLKEELKIKGG